MVSIAGVLSRARSAQKSVSDALKSAKTKEEKRRARAMKNKEERQERDIKEAQAQIVRLTKEEKRATTKASARLKQRRVDDLKRQVSVKDRVLVGVKRNAESFLDQTLKKYKL